MNDWPLVSACAQGDEHAFEILVKKYFPLVYAAAVRQVGNEPLAEVVVQSVFIIFALKAATLASRLPLTSWFLLTTWFVAQDALEQMPRPAGEEHEISALAEGNGGPEPLETGAASLVDEAILSLSRKEQQCIVARFFEGRSFREIAQLQHSSEEAAQKRVARSLEKVRAFLQRRGFKVSVASIPALISVNFTPAAHAPLVQATLAAVQAARQGKAEASASLQLADRVMRVLAWRQRVGVGLPVLLSVLVLGGGFLLLRNKSGSPPTRSPPFQVADKRIERLGKDWSHVLQRAAFLTRFSPGGPPPGDPNRAAYDQAVAVVQSETTRIARELNRVLREGSEREQLAEFLTVELRETLGLDADQQTDVFAQVRSQMWQGATFKDGLSSLLSTKAAFGAALRQRVSPEQRQRFDQTYGTNATGVLAFPGLVDGK